MHRLINLFKEYFKIFVFLIIFLNKSKFRNCFNKQIKKTAEKLIKHKFSCDVVEILQIQTNISGKLVASTSLYQLTYNTRTLFFFVYSIGIRVEYWYNVLI